MPTLPDQGPKVVFFGVADNGYCLFCCHDSCINTPTPTPAFDDLGRRVFEVGPQFVIVVEGVAGASGNAPAMSLQPGPPDGRPDLQIENTEDMGTGPTKGSTQVCDTGPISAGGGGVPGINPASFDPSSQFITDALNDFACRFGVFSPGVPCTFVDNTGEPKLVAGGTVQFCDGVAFNAQFPLGLSILTVKLRDGFGNTGPAAQIVLHVSQ